MTSLVVEVVDFMEGLERCYGGKGSKNCPIF